MMRVLATMLGFVLMSASVAMASSPSALSDLASRISLLEKKAQTLLPSGKNGLVPPEPIPSAGLSGSSEAGRIQLAQSAAGLAVRVDRLEIQMRQYTGQMEELNFRLRQLQEQLRRFQEDSEFRFQDLERGGKKPRKSSRNTAPSRQPTKDFQHLGAPPKSLGSLNQDQLPAGASSGDAPSGAAPLGTGTGAGPIDLSSMLSGGAGGAMMATPDNGTQIASAGSSVLSGDPSTDYDQAYSLILQGDYAGAERAFRAFVASYGQHRLTPNAYYWIGESLYQTQDYRGAIEVFLNAYSDFPNAQKAPDMLLKTGMSLRKINERDAACATYEELLQKFPNASSAIRQKVRAEIKSAQC